MTFKRIQVAIAAGRLDDAFDLLMGSDDRGHRDGQKWVDRLVDAFVARVSQHLDRGRVSDAKSDIDKAAALAGRREDVADLVWRVSQAEAQRRAQENRDNSAAREARKQVQAGALTLGERLLGDRKDDNALSVLASIGRGRELAMDAASRMKTAIKSGDFQQAIEIALSLPDEVRAHQSVAEQIGEFTAPLLQSADDAFNSGRLDRAEMLVGQLQRLSPHDAHIIELVDSLGRCRQIHESVRRGELDGALRDLRLLAQTMPAAKWVREAESSARQAAQHTQTLRTGPLGLMPAISPPISRPRGARQGTEELWKGGNRRTENRSESSPIAPLIPTGFGPSLLRIDGVGGILLLPHDEITIGCASRSTGYDLPLQIDGSRAPIVIRRRSEDYFAESDEDFWVAGQATRRRLLADGDLIEWGGHQRATGRIRFHQPVAASSSATLELKSGRLKQRDIRRVALMADSLVLGPLGSHFPIAGVKGPIIVYRSSSFDKADGSGGFAIKQPGHGPQRTLGLGDSLLIGDHRIALSQISLS